MNDETVHIPFLMLGAGLLIMAGVLGDRGLEKTSTAYAVVGVFMFACNAAIFWRTARHA